MSRDSCVRVCDRNFALASNTSIASFMPRHVSVPLESSARRHSTLGLLSALLGGPELSRDTVLSLRARNVERNATTRRVLHRDEGSPKSQDTLIYRATFALAEPSPTHAACESRQPKTRPLRFSRSITMFDPSLVRQRFVLSSNAVHVSCKRACET